MTDWNGIVPRRKLIEVALPLVAINKAAALEKGNPFLRGHPRSLHQWWARRPLSAARAVILAQMLDDPSSHPEMFETEEAQEKERARLFRLIEDIIPWEKSADEAIFARVREEIGKSWRATCTENKDHPQADELFRPGSLPPFCDPFAGGGSLPLEALRLGLRAGASDLNPVAVLINKAMIEVPGRFANQHPINPTARADQSLFEKTWRGAQGLAEDVRYYTKWMRGQAAERVGHLYPGVCITSAMAIERPDLRPYVGRELQIAAFIWARTVKSPNPAFANIDVPLASTFLLATTAGKEAYIAPIVEVGGYRFTVKTGKPKNAEFAKTGTKLARGANFRCIMSGAPIGGDYIKSEGQAKRMGVRLMAVVAHGDRARIYLPPTDEMEAAAQKSEPQWKPDVDISGSTQYLGIKPYGMNQFSDLFTARQLVALTTYSDLIKDVLHRARADALDAGFVDDGLGLSEGGSGATAYSEAIAIFAAFAIDKFADYNNVSCTWNPTNQNIGHLFTKQAIPMAWDFPEASPLFGGLSLDAIADGIARTIEVLPSSAVGSAVQSDCSELSFNEGPVIISTDPPYYDNVPYADLSDFFYVWLRHSVCDIFPELFATVTTPKAQELVAFAYRHDGKLGAEAFFLHGMTAALRRLGEHSHPAFPVTVYYAFKQAEATEKMEQRAQVGRHFSMP